MSGISRYLPMLVLAVGFVLAAAAHAQGTAGWSAPGTTNYPRAGLIRLAKLKFADPVGGDVKVRSLYGVAYDPTTGYALFGTAALVNPGRLIKVNLNGPVPVQVAVLQCAPGDVNLDAGAVDFSDPDPARHYAYFCTPAVPSRFIKIAMGAGDTTPTYAGSIALGAGENSALGLVLDTTAPDPAKHCAYVGTMTVPGNVVQVALGVGDALPARVAAIQLNPGENRIRRALADLTDPLNRYAYFISGPGGNPPFVAKIRLGEGADFRRVGVATLDTTEGPVGGAAIDTSDPDPAKHTLYLGTYKPALSTARITKVRTEAGDTSPTRLGSIETAAGERELSVAVLDPAGGFALFGSDHTHPARVYKVALGDGDALPEERGVLALAPGTDPYPVADGGNISGADAEKYGELYLQSALIDLERGFAYFGTDTVPGQVVKVQTSQKGAVKATRFVLNELAAVRAARFYSHAAAGHLRLALYDDATTMTLLWQSDSTSNTAAGDWLAVPIAAGSPRLLNLSSGTYWLAWQVDTTADVPSYTAGVEGDGFTVLQPYGPFPARLDAAIPTAERWSAEITFDAASAGIPWQALP